MNTKGIPSGSNERTQDNNSNLHKKLRARLKVITQVNIKSINMYFCL